MLDKTTLNCWRALTVLNGNRNADSTASIEECREWFRLVYKNTTGNHGFGIHVWRCAVHVFINQLATFGKAAAMLWTFAAMTKVSWCITRRSKLSVETARNEDLGHIFDVSDQGPTGEVLQVSDWRSSFKLERDGEWVARAQRCGGCNPLIVWSCHQVSQDPRKGEMLKSWNTL